MSERPTPSSIAICALVALESDPTSSLHDLNADPKKVATWLEKAVLKGPTNATSSTLQRLLVDLENAVGSEVRDMVLNTLEMAARSVDGLVDLMGSLQMAIAEGLVDGTSVCGVYLRQVCLGFEELSFESSALLWQEFSKRVSFLIAHNDTTTTMGSSLPTTTAATTTTWPLSSDQLEQVVQSNCIQLGQGRNINQREQEEASDENGDDFTFENIELQIRETLNQNPELPSAHFMRYLNCLRHGERIGALEALHQYFDYAMVQHKSPKDILQFSAILLAITHSSFGDQGLSLLATDEAVRVAQQSKDSACVAFALGWLFENKGHETVDRRDLLKRCATRAAQGQLRPLVTGANLSLAKHLLDEDRQEPSTAWARLLEVTAEQSADTNLQRLDRPTFMAAVPQETMESASRQRLITAGVWDALGLPALSELSSEVALQQDQDMSTEDIMSSIENISRLALYGTAVDQEKQSDESQCMYAVAIDTMSTLRTRLRVQGKETEEQYHRTLSLILHEWAVNRCELDDASAIGTFMESCLHPGVPNYAQHLFDVRIQKCLRLARQQKWELARQGYQQLLDSSKSEGNKADRTRLLLYLTTMELEANPTKFTAALSPLLEALAISEDQEIHHLHAVALSLLARVYLLLENPKRALAILQGAIPTLIQRSHVSFQGQAYLVDGKCRLSLAGLAENQKEERDQLKGALRSLEQSGQRFERCQDAFNLREVLYLKARIHSKLQDIDKRELAASRFVTVDNHLQMTSTAKCSNSILNAFQDAHCMQELVQRSL